MAKNKKRNQKQKSQSNLILIAGIAVVLLIAGAFFISQGGNDTVLTDENNALIDVMQSNVSPDEYQSLFVAQNTDHILIDVRTPDEFNSGHIAGAININVETLANRLSEIPNDKPIVVYCRSGNRSATASDILADAGYSNIYDLGGVINWTAAGYPLQ